MQWLSARAGAFYRLVTQSEWQYAASGRATGYGYGVEEQRRCVYGPGNGVSGGRDTVFAQCDRGFLAPRSVGGAGPNELGLYEIHANAWEWTDTCRTSDQQTSCGVQDVRGHIWRVTPWRTRAFDLYYLREFRYNNLGFRVVRALSGTSHGAGLDRMSGVN